MSRLKQLRRQGHRSFLNVHRMEERIAPAIVTWDHGGNDANWFNAANWSTDMVPGMDDDVELGTTAGSVVYNGLSSSIKSVKLADNLLIESGSLTVTNSLKLSANQIIYASGAGASLNAPGMVELDAGSVRASSGGVINLTGLTSINSKGPSFITADGVGSLVNLPNLTTIVNAGDFTHVWASNGGQVNLPALTSMSGGQFDFQSYTPGSEINANKLATIEVPLNNFAYLQAYNGGTVEVAPTLSTLERVQLTVGDNGFPTNQLTSFKNSQIFVYSGTPSFAALTDITGSSIYVSGASTVSFSGVTTIPENNVGHVYFEARDAGAVLNLPNLTTVNNASFVVHFRAYDNGSVSIPNVTTLSAGSSELYAHSNGVVSAPSLGSISPPALGQSYVHAVAGGTIQVFSGVTSLNRVQLEVSGSGFPTAQLKSFNTGNLFVNGGVVSFASLTNIDHSSLYVSGGAMVTLPGITSIGTSNYVEPYFETTDAGTMLSFPNLTSVASQNPSRIHFRAYYDSSISLGALTSLANGNSEIRATQGGIVNAPMLAAFSPPVGSYSYLGAFDDGVVNLSPAITQLERVQLEVEANGFATGALTSFKYGSLFIYGGSPSFAKLTNIDSSSIFSYYDSSVILTGITSIGASEVGDINFVSGYGPSQLSFPNLVTVAKQDPARIHFQSIEGGTISLPQLSSLSAGNARLWATSNSSNESKIIAPLLSSFSPSDPSFSYLLATGLSSIQVSPSLTKLDRVQLEIDDAGAFPIGQLTEFTRGYLYGYGGNLVFPLVNKIDGTSVYGSNESTITLSGLTSIGVSDFGSTVYQAYGANVVINMPNLTTLTGDSSTYTAIRSYYGGRVAMPLVGKFDTGLIDIISAFTDSVVDLGSLSKLTVPLTGTGYLTVFDNATLNTGNSFSMFNVRMEFDKTAKFDFTNFDIGDKSIVNGFGTLKANVSNSGELRIDNFNFPNTLNIDGNYTQTSTGVLRVDIGGKTAGSTFDQLVVTGQAKLDGTVQVNTINGFQPVAGDSFDVVTFASRVGTFSGYTGLDVGGNVELVPVHNTTDFRFNTVLSTGAIVTGFSPVNTIPGPVDYLEVTFSEPIQANSIDASDVSVTGPGGPYVFSSASQQASNIVRIYFTTPITLNGTYNVVLGPEILDASNNPMNQNGVAPNGETPGDQYSNSFTINAPDLTIDSFTGMPANANFGQTVNLSWTIRNSGAIQATGLWSDRIWLSTDNKIDFGDTYLGEKASPGVPMNVNATYTSNLSVQLPTTPTNPDGPYFILLEVDIYGQLGESSETNNVKAQNSTLANPPRVAEVIINDGAAQRSRVNTITVIFSETVTFQPTSGAAFTVSRTGPGGPTGIVTLGTPVVDNSTSQTKVTLSFLASGFFSNNSLIDGNYSVTVNAAAVTDGTQTLDGDANGVTGDNYSASFYRLFGDANGDRSVNAGDFAQFRGVFGLSGSSIFDANNDNQTNAADFAQFRARFGLTLIP